MMAGEVCLAIKDPVTVRIIHVNIVALLDVGEVAPSQPDLAAVVPDIGVEVDALTGGLGGGQAPLHAGPPGTVVRYCKKNIDLVLISILQNSAAKNCIKVP